MRTVAAELLKLRRSWSTWILIGIVALAELLLGYLLIYFVVQAPTPGGEDFGQQGMLSSLRGDQLVGNVLTMLAGLGGSLALVLGAMHSAREYGWHTMPTILTQGPTRLGVFAAKAGSLAVVVLVMVIATFAAGVAGTALVAGLDGTPLSFPAPVDMGAGLATGYLIVGAWAALGLALGFLLRSTALAIGLGLVYALVLETIIVGLSYANQTFDQISRGLLGINASALAASFGPAIGGSQFGVLSFKPAVAASVLAGYIVISIALAALVFRRRDVT